MGRLREYEGEARAAIDLRGGGWAGMKAEFEQSVGYPGKEKQGRERKVLEREAFFPPLVVRISLPRSQSIQYLLSTRHTLKHSIYFEAPSYCIIAAIGNRTIIIPFVCMRNRRQAWMCGPVGEDLPSMPEALALPGP